MSRRKLTFATGEIYHVYSRGVEKRKIFLKTSDYVRFADDLYELNDKNYVVNSQYYLGNSSIVRIKGTKREPLVEILAFAIMPNHYHLILRQLQEDGVRKFMQKFGTGYAMYFNKKHERVGPLFQGRFKAIHVETNDYLQNLVGYIHTNPADLYRGPASIEFLEKYRWSSYLDYSGSENFPMITSRDFLLEVMGGKEGIKNSAIDWIAHREEKSRTIPEIIEIRSR
jgi:putative transposase